MNGLPLLLSTLRIPDTAVWTNHSIVAAVTLAVVIAYARWADRPGHVRRHLAYPLMLAGMYAGLTTIHDVHRRMMFSVTLAKLIYLAGAFGLALVMMRTTRLNRLLGGVAGSYLLYLILTGTWSSWQHLREREIATPGRAVIFGLLMSGPPLFYGVRLRRSFDR